MLISEFSQYEKVILCTRTIIYNKFEQMNLLGDILNAGDNVDDQEDYGFTGSFYKLAPTVIDDYTKKKLLNFQLEIRDPREIQRIIKNNMMNDIR